MKFFLFSMLSLSLRNKLCWREHCTDFCVSRASSLVLAQSRYFELCCETRKACGGAVLGCAGLGWAGLAESVFWKSEIVHHSSCPLSTAELSCSCFCSGSGDKICAEIGGDKQQHISFAGKCCACAQFSELKPIKFLNFGINILVR